MDLSSVFEDHALILCAVIIFACAGIGAVLPYKFSNAKRFLALGNTFGGGVLLSAGIVHLTGDAVEQFEAVTSGWAVDYDYPWAVFFVSLGFLSTLVIEEIALWLTAIQEHKEHHKRHKSSCDHHHKKSTWGWCEMVWNPTVPRRLSTTPPPAATRDHHNSNPRGTRARVVTTEALIAGAPLPTGNLKQPFLVPVLGAEKCPTAEEPCNGCDETPFHRKHARSISEALINDPCACIGYGTLDDCAHKDGKKSKDIENPPDTGVEGSKHSSTEGGSHFENIGAVSLMTAVIFLVAISFHSFLAGVGLGASKGREIWRTLAAIMAHKGLAAFSLSTCFVKTGTPTSTHLLCMLIFSFMTPIGIMVGYFVSGMDKKGPTTGILIALAAGSFIYVGILEVIAKEMHSEKDKRIKLAMLCLGWGLMCLLAVWT